VERHSEGISIDLLPVHITPSPPRIECRSFDSVLDLKSFDVDRYVEKNAELSPTLPPHSKAESVEISSRAVDVDLETPSEGHSSHSCRERHVEHPVVPAYHRSFTPPSLYHAASDEDFYETTECILYQLS
jgi:hypothetical protein